MSIGKMFRNSLTVAKENPMMFVPMLAASLVTALVSLIVVGSAVPVVLDAAAQSGEIDTAQALADIGAVGGGMSVVMAIGGLAYLLAHAMTVGMADIALKGEKANLGNGWARLAPRIVPVVLTTILVGVLVGLGFVLLVIPGVILAFFLMFAYISVMVDGAGAFQSVGNSFKFVGKNFGATFVIFLVILGLALLVGLVSFVLNLIPVLGQLLTLVLSAVYAGFITILLVGVYNELRGESGSAPETEPEA
ncbi:MAG: hypothetical protein ACOCZB_01355 [Spirochaetota bacterium]